MIGAIVMIFALIWIYQTGIKASVSNIFMWVGICAAVFLGSQVLLYDVNIWFADLFNGQDVSGNYERGLASVGDRKNIEGFQSTGGAFVSYFLELMPPTVGFLLLAVIRLKFITKESLTVANLFSGINDMVSSATKDALASVKDGIKKK